MKGKLRWCGGATVLFLAACGSAGQDTHPGSGSTGSSTSSTGGTITGAGGSGAAGVGGAGGAGGIGPTSGTGGQGGAVDMTGFTTLFTIVFENHDYNEVVGSPDAPYLNSLIAQYGLATNYQDSGTHPSLPNYLYMISGDTQYPGVVDVNPDWLPYFPSNGDNLGHQLEVAGIPWRSYQESMGAPCNLDAQGDYAPKHDPFLYFSDIQRGPGDLCALRNVDYSEFPADLDSGAYRYMWITPNLIDDGHNPTNDPVTGLKQSDAWLMRELPKILSSEVYKKGGVVFITWDEAEGRNGDSGDQIPMIIVSPKLKAPGMKSATALSHASYLATIEEIFGLPRLGAAAKATSLMEFFKP